MFPSLPVPAILAALQTAPVGVVIERALAGRLDVKAVPSPAAAPPPQSKGAGARQLSGKTVRIGEALAAGKFPADALPAHMLPRDLGKLQVRGQRLTLLPARTQTHTHSHKHPDCPTQHRLSPQIEVYSTSTDTVAP